MYHIRMHHIMMTHTTPPPPRKRKGIRRDAGMESEITIPNHTRTCCTVNVRIEASCWRAIMIVVER